VQLRVMYRLTPQDLFAQVADRWERYSRSQSNRIRALLYKVVFKVLHY
jgi:hypothetical protein